MHVGHHGRLGHARIDHDERGAGVGFEPPAQDRVVVGDVRADEHDDVGALEVFVRAGWSVAAKRSLVAGHGGRHAERRVAVVVGRAKAELHELAQRVELFSHELPGADDAHRVAAVCGLHVAKPGGHRLERLRPADRREPAARSAGLEQRLPRAAIGRDRVVLGKAFRAQHAAVHRMVGVATYTHGAPVLDPDEHAAAHRAVAARRRDPPVGRPLRRDEARHRIHGVGIPLRLCVETEQPHHLHAASLPSAR